MPKNRGQLGEKITRSIPSFMTVWNVCCVLESISSLQDKCHRFLNALEPGTQIPVHHHSTKAETFVILKGKVRVSTYDDNGEVLESCVISQEEGTYGVDIPKNVWHGLECLEPSVLLECKEGPFVEHEVDGILEIKKL